MIEIYEGHRAPDTVRAISPTAPWFIVEDPNEGSPLSRAEVMVEIRRNFLKAESMNFIQSTTRVDGKIIHVGSKVDPLIAQIRLAPKPGPY